MHSTTLASYKERPTEDFRFDVDHTLLLWRTTCNASGTVNGAGLDMLSGTGLNVWSVFYKRSLSGGSTTTNVHSPFFRDKLTATVATVRHSVHPGKNTAGRYSATRVSSLRDHRNARSSHYSFVAHNFGRLKNVSRRSGESTLANPDKSTAIRLSLCLSLLQGTRSLVRLTVSVFKGNCGEILFNKTASLSYN